MGLRLYKLSAIPMIPIVMDKRMMPEADVAIFSRATDIMIITDEKNVTVRNKIAKCIVYIQKYEQKIKSLYKLNAYQ